jgi:CheY-like chemotaxis protein
MQPEEPVEARVLVVEDDESMRELLRLHLGNAGYKVTLAQDATIAGRKLLASTPDLIIADVHLPFMSGLEFASILMADQTLPNIPLVLISAHEHYRQHAEALGVAFLLKPILKAQLLETVENVLSSANVDKNYGKGGALSAGRSAVQAPRVVKETVRQATLRRARDLAGGVSYLGRKLGIGVNSLDGMIHGNQDIPQWVFLQAAEFVADAETARETPPGFPPDWDTPAWLSEAHAHV